MIVTIMQGASLAQIEAAVRHTADHLHVPEEVVTPTVAVGYVVRHFKAGELEGWDGFITDARI